MTSHDDRYLLRRRNIDREQSANKFTRAMFQIRKRMVYERYVRCAGPSLDSSHAREQNLLISVAFNNSSLIKLQAEAVTKFLSGYSEFMVVDNSPDDEEKREIRSLADSYGFTYIQAPHNPFSWIDPSLSHSGVLDWAWKRIVTQVKPGTVVFLDHDVFPISPVVLPELLQGSLAAGYRRSSGLRWLLWPGLLALDYQRVSRYRPRFMPHRDTDSGGSMWWRVYSRVQENEIRFVDREQLVFGDTSRRSGDGSGGEMHLLDGKWLHLVDGSGWSDGDGKLGKLPLPSAEPRLEEVLFLVGELRNARNDD